MHPCALLGQFMVSTLVFCIACSRFWGAMQLLCTPLPVFICCCVQVFDCDKAQMKVWSCEAGKVRQQEATLVVATLAEKCDKFFVV